METGWKLALGKDPYIFCGCWREWDTGSKPGDWHYCKKHQEYLDITWALQLDDGFYRQDSGKYQIDFMTVVR